MRCGQLIRGRGIARRSGFQQLLGDIPGDLERFLDCPPLGHQPLDVIARREIKTLWKLLDVQRDDVFHD